MVEGGSCLIKAHADGLVAGARWCFSLTVVTQAFDLVGGCTHLTAALPLCERIGRQAEPELAVILVRRVAHHLMDAGGVEVA